MTNEEVLKRMDEIFKQGKQNLKVLQNMEKIFQEGRKQRIAEIIDEWYFNWKDKMTDAGVTHKLGFAKENLKNRLERVL